MGRLYCKCFGAKSKYQRAPLGNFIAVMFERYAPNHYSKNAAKITLPKFNWRKMKMRSYLRVFLFTALSVGLSAAQVVQPPSWRQPAEPFRIVGNLYYVGSADLTSYLFVTPKGDILLDSGVPENVTMIWANVEKLGFQLKDVKILLNSHAHFDHAGGFAEVKKITGAKLFASAGDAPELA